jgi:hypothetical protein
MSECRYISESGQLRRLLDALPTRNKSSGDPGDTRDVAAAGLP